MGNGSRGHVEGSKQLDVVGGRLIVGTSYLNLMPSQATSFSFFLFLFSFFEKKILIYHT